MVPAISDKMQRRKLFLMVSLIVGIIMTYVVGTSTMTELIYVSSTILGFFLISVMPIVLSMLDGRIDDVARGI